MIDENTVIFGIVIFLVFIWRFSRTRQIYLVSMDVESGNSEAIPFNPHDFHSFANQVLFGHRSLKPASFFVRGFVFAVVGFGLLPFKDYQPPLYWLAVILIALYIPWCFIHGVMLKKKAADAAAK